MAPCRSFWGLPEMLPVDRHVLQGVKRKGPEMKPCKGSLGTERPEWEAQKIEGSPGKSSGAQWKGRSCQEEGGVTLGY